MDHSLILLVEAITPGEQRVLDALAEGKSDKQIAVDLFLARGTVATHMVSLREKLRAHSRLQVVLNANDSGVIDLTSDLSPEVLAILTLERSKPGSLAEAIAEIVRQRPALLASLKELLEGNKPDELGATE